MILARLGGRMILNAAGGVMENAGMCLDRFTGAPYIPGSAVKGCVRRTAIQEVSDADGVPLKAEILTTLAIAFGWGARDWSDKDTKQGTPESDFRYACGQDWPIVKEETQARLVGLLRACAFPKAFAGRVCFMPAHLHETATPDIVLDVLTCHHPAYYGYNTNKASDTESPNPVTFPVVNEGNVFVFAVLTPGFSAPECDHVMNWLRNGLRNFGLGGKTSAGYGWFDVDDAPRWDRIAAKEREERERVAAAQRSKEERERKAEEERTNREEKAKLDEERKSLGGRTRGQWESIFRDQIAFERLDDAERKKAVELLCGPFVAEWERLKNLAEKGNKKERVRALPVVNQVRATAKTMKQRMP